jgi:hypothetical protein
MTLDIAFYRLHNQRLLGNKLDAPADVVRWLGAVQAQDYAGAKWAVGQRMQDAADAALEQAMTDGAILRTHLLRPTWHFVTPADIHWMLALTAPRVRAAIAFMDRQLELDNIIFKRSNAALTKALKGGKQLTRAELGSALQESEVNTDDLRLGHLLMHAELDEIICSGARHGKQFTYALLDERVAQTKALEHDEALGELAKRYFTSHGPATLKDFVWWSGLSTADAKNGLEMIKSGLEKEALDDETYWFVTSNPKAEDAVKVAHLLPNYDEYTVGYTDRSAIFDASHSHKLDSRASILAQHTILVSGQAVGTWKRTLKKNEVTVQLSPFITLTRAENKVVRDAADDYGKFLGLAVTLNESV